MNFFKYIPKSMGSLFYLFAAILSCFIYGAFHSYYSYGSTVGFYVLGLIPVYLIIFYFDYRKNKKNKTGLFTENKDKEIGRV